MSDLTKRLTRNAELPGYLNQLRELAAREVTEDQLGSLEEVERLKGATSQLKGCLKKLIEIAPEDLTQERFTSFVH